MKIVLVGGENLISPTMRSLVENHDIVLIEALKIEAIIIVSRFDVIGLLGNGADFAILEQASVQECDIFIAPNRIR